MTLQTVHDVAVTFMVPCIGKHSEIGTRMKKGGALLWDLELYRVPWIWMFGY
jgi:hypothetical protein